MKLRHWLYDKKITIKDFAEKVGCSYEHMKSICYGVPPGKFLKRIIEEHTNGEVEIPTNEPKKLS